MRHVYIAQWEEYITPGHDRRVYGDPVPPGWVLLVRTCYLHMPKSKAGDVATLLLEHGGQELVLRSRARDFAKQGMSAFNPFYVGEHQRVIGESLNSDEKDTITLNIVGEMIPLRKWRRGKV